MMGSLLLDKRVWMGPALLAMLLLLLAYAGGAANAQSGAEGEPPRILLPALQMADTLPDRADDAFAPGEIAVGVRRDALGAAAAADVIEASVIETMSLQGLDGADGDAGVDGYLIRVTPGEERATIEQLLKNPAVVFAQPNWIVRAADSGSAAGAAGIPFGVNDPLYEDEQWYLQRIFASRAWALSGRVEPASAAELPIRVAVIDSGVDHTHDDIRDNLSLTGINYIDPTQPPVDDCGHGTHVTGLIAASINNDVGIAGTAAGVRVVPYKVLEWDPGPPGVCKGPVRYVVDAIRHAADLGDVAIINLSLELDENFAPLEAAVNYARSQGVLVIGAAGNCQRWDLNCPVKYPAAYSAVRAVAATDYDNGRAWYSPRGDALDLAAPGGTESRTIVSTWPAGVRQLCLYPVEDRDDYCGDLGTSMSAGVATGAAALVWSVRPQLTAEDVWDILEESVRPLPEPENEAGDGLVDAERAVRYALRSRLDVAPRDVHYARLAGAPRFETALLLQNPSLEPVRWLITDTHKTGWLDADAPNSGTVRYGEPVRATLSISPTHLASGSYRTTFTVEGERADGSRLEIPVTALLDVISPATESLLYMPVLDQQDAGEPVWPFVEYVWQTPDTVTPGAMGRVDRYLPKDSSIGITLPVTIAVNGQSFADARIYSDGYVLMPASERLDRETNACLPFASVSGVAAFGWWGALDPGASGARVSTFQAGPDRFVIEFENVRIEGGTTADRVSFQIVLYEDGDVGMNYRRTPYTGVVPMPVTVGVQRLDGRFYNELACITPAIEVGTVPRAFQSLLLREEDLY